MQLFYNLPEVGGMKYFELVVSMSSTPVPSLPVYKKNRYND